MSGYIELTPTHEYSGLFIGTRPLSLSMVVDVCVSMILKEICFPQSFLLILGVEDVL